MDVSAIIYAGIGGGGGAVLGTLVGLLIEKIRRPTEGPILEGRRSSLQSALGIVLAASGVFLLGSLYKNMTLPRLVPLDDKEVIMTVPVFGIIKEQSPKDYARMVLPLDKAVRNGKATQDTLNEMRAVYFDLMGKKAKIASADTLRALEKVDQTHKIAYREKAPHICTLMFNGEPYPSVVDYLSEEDVRVEQEAITKLFTSLPRDQNFVANLEIGKTLFEKLFSEALGEVGVKNIRPKNDSSPLKHQEICDLAVLYSKNLIALDDDDFLHTKAYLDSQG